MLQQFPGLPPGPSLSVVSIHFTKNMRKNLKLGLFMACRVFHRCSDIAFPVKRNYSNINLPLSDIASGKVDDNTQVSKKQHPIVRIAGLPTGSPQGCLSIRYPGKS